MLYVSLHERQADVCWTLRSKSCSEERRKEGIARIAIFGGAIRRHSFLSARASGDRAG